MFGMRHAIEGDGTTIPEQDLPRACPHCPQDNTVQATSRQAPVPGILKSKLIADENGEWYMCDVMLGDDQSNYPNGCSPSYSVSTYGSPYNASVHGLPATLRNGRRRSTNASSRRAAFFSSELRDLPATMRKVPRHRHVVMLVPIAVGMPAVFVLSRN